jgi:hypothetical protein
MPVVQPLLVISCRVAVRLQSPNKGLQVPKKALGFHCRKRYHPDRRTAFPPVCALCVTDRSQIVSTVVPRCVRRILRIRGAIRCRIVQAAALRLFQADVRDFNRCPRRPAGHLSGRSPSEVVGVAVGIGFLPI